MVPNTSPLRELSADERRQLNNWLEEFDLSRDENRLAIRMRQLAEVAHPLRAELILGLLRIDLLRQWKAGRRILVEGYLHDYPELGTVDTVRPEVIRAEMEARLQAGSFPGLDELVQRFPGRSDEIHQLYGELQPGTATPDPGPTLATVGVTRSDLPKRKTEELLEHFGRYRILRTLGKGGMGTVYLARDTQLERSVAIKVPHFQPDDDPHLLERFYREARAAATLSHPNLCPVYDVGVHDGKPFLTMAFIAGKPLSEYIRDGKAMPQRPVAAIVHKLAVALDEAHRKGIVHRDLKPANIMINERHEPVIMDFGLAQRTDQNQERLTRQGMLLGTPAYMSPEQVAGDVNAVGRAADIYSLGVILYELLTGRVPFQGPTTAIFGKILTETPPAPSSLRPDLDPALEVICRKAMAKSPAERFATAADLSNALDEYLRGQNRSDSAPSRTATESGAPAPDSGALRATEIDPGRFYSDLASQFFAALAAQRVTGQSEAGATRTPMSHWPWIALTLVLAFSLTGIAALALSRGRHREETVLAHLHLDGIAFHEPVVVVFLDGTRIPADQLAKPIALKTGDHEVVVKHGDEIVETRRFRVGMEDNQKTVEVPAALPATVQHNADPPSPKPSASDSGKETAAPPEKKHDTPLAGDTGPDTQLPPAVKALVTALTDEDGSVRKNAAQALGQLGDKSAVPALVKRVGDSVWLVDQFGPRDPEAGGKSAALTALKTLAPDRVVEALTLCLEAKEYRMRRWAAVELRNLNDKAAVPALARRVADAVWVWDQFGPKDPEAGGKADALAALQSMAPERVVEVLAPQLQSMDEHVRRWAAVELGKHKDKAAVPALMRRVADDVWIWDQFGSKDPEAGGKADALIALKQLAPERAPEALLEAMKSKNSRIKAWAAEELGRLPTKPEESK
jgi:serine/threonine protein kinase/HEAT repeat protein